MRHPGDRSASLLANVLQEMTERHDSLQTAEPPKLKTIEDALRAVADECKKDKFWRGAPTILAFSPKIVREK